MTTPDPVKMLARKPEAKPDPWKVRCSREHRELLQRELADKMGLGPNGNQTISRAEQYGDGDRVGARTLASMAAALQLPIESFLSDAPTFDANKLEHDQWVADGRPPLQRWLRERHASKGKRP